MHSFTDQLGRIIQIKHPPQRIISLVPSQTELLFDLGLGDRIVGITKFCNHPLDKVNRIPKVGGTKKLNFDSIQSLTPDLIIGNKEENEQTQIEFLMNHYPVWMSDIVTLHDALQMISGIGSITNTQARADVLIARITENFAGLMPCKTTLKVVYLIWKKPFMAAGPGTFINVMLQYCGFVNIIEKERYPELALAEMQNLKPDAVLLSSEPYPFKGKHINEFKSIFPDSGIHLVDGEMFSWYGSRLLLAAEYFRQLVLEMQIRGSN